MRTAPCAFSFLLDAEVVLVVVRRFECAGREGIEADGERASWPARRETCARRPAGFEERLELLVRGGGSAGGAVGDAGRNRKAAHLAADAADEGGRIRRVGGGEIGNLCRNNVVEDAEAEMDHGSWSDLVGERDAGLPNQQRSGGEQRTHPGLNGLVERLIDRCAQDRETIRLGAQKDVAD